MMHEVTFHSVNVSELVRFDLAKLATARGFGKGPRPARGSAFLARWVPARTTFALVLRQLMVWTCADGMTTALL